MKNHSGYRWPSLSHLHALDDVLDVAMVGDVPSPSQQTEQQANAQGPPAVSRSCQDFGFIFQNKLPNRQHPGTHLRAANPLWTRLLGVCVPPADIPKASCPGDIRGSHRGVLRLLSSRQFFALCSGLASRRSNFAALKPYKRYMASAKATV